MVVVATKRKMNYWDKLPSDIQDKVLKVRAAQTIQRNWCRHPALRSTCLAKGVMKGKYGIEIVSPWTAAALEYCAKYSGSGDPVFWGNLSLELLYQKIQCQYVSDMGHGWIDRCIVALDILVDKYSDVWCPEYNKTLLSTVRFIEFQSGYNTSHTDF